MSASLVGSEMCIRDSIFTTQLIRTTARKPKQTPTRTTEPKHAFIEQPVSYTHLTLPTICSV
eukprot:4823638-Alexandrium_andersonii.AAC.1